MECKQKSSKELENNTGTHLYEVEHVWESSPKPGDDIEGCF